VLKTEETRRRISQQAKSSRVAEHHYYTHDDNGSSRQIGTAERGYQPPPCSGCGRKAEVIIIIIIRSLKSIANTSNTENQNLILGLELIRASARYVRFPCSFFLCGSSRPYVVPPDRPSAAGIQNQNERPPRSRNKKRRQAPSSSHHHLLSLR
jgi:hypothetical protein